MTKDSNPRPKAARGLRSTTIRFISLALVFFTLIALGAVAFFTERGIMLNRDSVIHTYQVRSQLNDLQLAVVRAESDETNNLLMGRNGKMPLTASQPDLAHRYLDELRKLTIDNRSQQQRLEELAQLLKDSDGLFHTPANSRGPGAQLLPSERRRQQKIGEREKQIASLVSSMQDEEESLLEQRLNAWDYLFKRNVLMLILAFGIVILLFAYNFRLLVSEVARTKDTEKRSRANAESYRVMSGRILELQDLERRRIARELHDSVGQYLAGLKINLNQLESGARIDAAAMLRETVALTDYAIQEVRTISHLLHPPLLEELGFLPAARWYLDEYGKRSQVNVSLNVQEPIERLPREVEIALFRVLQESLTNVYRHANAQSVDVRIVCRDGHVTLTVADDGQGIPRQILARFNSGAASGIGLAGMRERLAEFGGEIEVESSSGGTVVKGIIPTGACAPDRPGTAPAPGFQSSPAAD